MYDNLQVSDNVEQMKNCVYSEMLSDKLKKYGADFFDESILIDKYLKAKKEVGLFKNPGENPFKTISKDKIIGRVIGVNSNKNWIKLSWPGIGDFWIINNVDNYRIVGENLTEAERNEAREIGADSAKEQKKISKPIQYIGEKTFETGKDVTYGAIEAGSTILDAAAMLGRNIKTVLIIVIMLVVAYVFLSFKK